MYPRPGKEGFGAFVMHQVEELRALGHEVDVLDFPGYRSKLEYLKAAVRVYRRTRQQRYSVVHAHYGLTGLVALFRNAAPLVVTVHGSDALVGVLEPFITKCITRIAAATIVVSPKIHAKLGGDIIPCGVDMSLFAPQAKVDARRRLGLDVDRKYVLFPFDPNRAIKRFDIAREAVSRLAAEGHDVDLLTVSKVHFREMPWYYSAADVMILCSDSEGSPTSVKEALACNLPVVSTDIGDVGEIMSGISGVEIVAQNADSLALALKRTLDRSAAGSVFEGRQAMSRYSQRKTADAIVQVYSRVIEAASSRKPAIARLAGLFTNLRSN
jgi:glycosyltransferase involved in cell wall biosynthesis